MTVRSGPMARAAAASIAAALAAALLAGGAGRATTAPDPTPPATAARTIAPDPPPGPPLVTGSQPGGNLPAQEAPRLTITEVGCGGAEPFRSFVAGTATNPLDGGPARQYSVSTTGFSGADTVSDGESLRFQFGGLAVGPHTLTASDVASGVSVEETFTIAPCEDSTTTSSPSTTTTRPGDSAVTVDGSAPDGSVVDGSGAEGSSSNGAVVGHSQVVAQGVVAFPAGSFRWDHQPIGTGGWPLLLDASPAMLLAADGPDPLLVQIDGVSDGLLHGGEAAFIAAGTIGTASPTFDGAVAGGRRVTFVTGEGEGSLTPGEGRRDVNLVRDVLAPGETFTASSGFPILVVVTDGTVTTADGQTLSAEQAATLGVDVELLNTGDQPAVILAAIVGELVP